MRFLALLLLFASSAFAQQVPIYCKPDVINAMRSIWAESGKGRTGEEATFTVNGNIDKYTIYHQAHTRQVNQQSITIYDNTFAIFHVHPSGSGVLAQFPSSPENNAAENGKGDTGIADEKKVDIYVVSQWGLTVYSWRTRQIFLLRDDLSWTKQCPAHITRELANAR